MDQKGYIDEEQHLNCRNGKWNCNKDWTIATVCNITDYRITGRLDTNYLTINKIDVYSYPNQTMSSKYKNSTFSMEFPYT